MDTYASSASGTNGFYDMPALAPARRRVLRHGVQPEPGRVRLGVLTADERALLRPDHRRRVRGRGSALQGHPGPALLRHRLADDERHPHRDGDRAGDGRLPRRRPGQRASPLLGPRHRQRLDLVSGRARSGTRPSSRTHRRSTTRPSWRSRATSPASASGPWAWTATTRTTSPRWTASLPAVKGVPTGPATTSASPPATASPAPPAPSPTPPSHAPDTTTRTDDDHDEAFRRRRPRPDPLPRRPPPPRRTVRTPTRATGTSPRSP